LSHNISKIYRKNTHIKKRGSKQSLALIGV